MAQNGTTRVLVIESDQETRAEISDCLALGIPGPASLQRIGGCGFCTICPFAGLLAPRYQGGRLEACRRIRIVSAGTATGDVLRGLS